LEEDIPIVSYHSPSSGYKVKVVGRSYVESKNEYGVSCVAIDPICKMKVSEGQAKYTSMHNGTKYFFCCAACKQEFDKNPSKYVK
jgi:YHS domain-containing protein